MLELFAAICLLADPGTCETRLAGRFDTEAACQQAGRDLRPDTGHSVDAWACGQYGPPPFWISEVAPGVFVHKGQHAEASPENRGDLANIGFVIGTQAVAVIDAGGSPPVARDLLQAIRARTDLPVAWLILTHMHPDHVMGADIFAEAGARIVGHPNLPAALGARLESYTTSLARETGLDPAPPRSLATLEPAPRNIDLGDRVLELRTAPLAHTGTDLTVRDLQTDTWFLGDLLFAGHLPSLDGSLKGWIEHLNTLAALPAARVVPGHGPVRVAWPGAADPLRTYLSGLRTNVRALIDEGLALIDVLGQDQVPVEGDWLLVDTFHPRNVTTAWRELEWD